MIKSAIFFYNNDYSSIKQNKLTNIEVISFTKEFKNQILFHNLSLIMEELNFAQRRLKSVNAYFR